MKKLSISMLLAIIIVATIYSFYPASQHPLETTLVYPKLKSLPEVNLLDHHNNTFSRQQFQGKWSIVFFGFTFCPDVCPTTLAALSQVAKKLPPETLEKVQFIFISVDPERDTVEGLAAYIPFYHPDFIALTGDNKEINKLALALGAAYMKVPEKDGYTMSHTDRLFIINPKAERFGIFSKPPGGSTNIEAIARDLLSITHK